MKPCCDCRKPISKAAVECPLCGAPQPKVASKLPWIVLAVILVVVVSEAGCLMAGAAESKIIPVLTIGTNTYKNASIKKRNAADVIVKFDRGLTMAKSKDLPEPFRSEYFNEPEALKVESRNQESVSKQKENEARKKHIAIEKERALKFRMIDGELVPLKLFQDYSANVLSVNGNTGTVQIYEMYEQRASAPIGSMFSTYRPVIRTEKRIIGTFRVLNLPRQATPGGSVHLKAYKSKNGTLDCGLDYIPQPFDEDRSPWK